MTETIYKPRCLREFKETITRSNEFNARMTLRWNDLTPEAKEKLTLKIKTYSRSLTVRYHPKATTEAINTLFTDLNPIIEQTKHSQRLSYQPNWSFGGGYISSAKWLENLNTIIIISLKLRRLSNDRFANYFLGIGGWGSYPICHDFKNRTLRELNINSIDEERMIEPEEISLTEVTNASHRATAIRTHN